MKGSVFIFVPSNPLSTHSLPLRENPAGPIKVLITHGTLFPHPSAPSVTSRNLEDHPQAKIWFFGESNRQTSGEIDQEKRQRHN